MTKYHCRKCSYSFEKNKAPNRCPYCASDNTVEEVKSAQTILDEISEEAGIIEQSRKERESSRSSR